MVLAVQTLASGNHKPTTGESMDILRLLFAIFVGFVLLRIVLFAMLGVAMAIVYIANGNLANWIISLFN